MDVEFADQKSIFAAVSKVDTFVLAKLLSSLSEGAVRTKILGVLSARRREEVELEMKDMREVDPMEVQQIGMNLIGEVKSFMLQAK